MKDESRMLVFGAMLAAGAFCTSADAAQPPRDPAVGDAVPKIEMQRLDAQGDGAKPGTTREWMVDHSKKRPVVLIFSSFT